MINKDSKQELDEIVAQAALQQTESQKQAQALAPGAVQQQDKPSFFNVSPFNDYRMEGLRMDPPKELCPHILVEQETTILFSGPGVGKLTWLNRESGCFMSTLSFRSSNWL